MTLQPERADPNWYERFRRPDGAIDIAKAWRAAYPQSELTQRGSAFIASLFGGHGIRSRQVADIALATLSALNLPEVR